MPLSTACKGIVKVQLRICDNHSRSFTGADVPFGACRVTLQACSSLCEQVQKMCSGKRAGSSQLAREGCSPSIVQFWEPTGGLEPPTCSLRVIIHALQGRARACKSRVFKPASFLCLALCCTVLRSRWCQSGVRKRWITHRRFLCKRDMQLRMRASTQPHRRL